MMMVSVYLADSTAVVDQNAWTGRMKGIAVGIVHNWISYLTYRNLY